MYQFPATHQVQVADEIMEYSAAGRGPGTVVLVNGAGGPIEGWYKVYEPLSGLARVFAYNRPGVGRSSKPSRPQTALHMVNSLRNLLLVVDLPPPYLLVGHSLGGLIVNLFARLHPEEVSAAVFIEASTPEDVVVLHRHNTALQRLLAGVVAKMAPPNPNAETEQVTTSVAQIQEAPDFPPIPVTVISGAKHPMAWATADAAIALRAQHQRELAHLSPLGKQVIASGSGHFPQFSEPQLVVAEIEQAIKYCAKPIGQPEAKP